MPSTRRSRKAKLAPLPRALNATNAYELLTAVKRALRDEYRRANMRVDLTTSQVYMPTKPPACGTVGCIGGWVAALAGRNGPHETYSPLGIASWLVFGHTDSGTPGRYFEGRGGVAYDVFNSGAGDACDTTTPGTRAHARAVIARINRLLRDHGDALRARTLVREGNHLSPLILVSNTPIAAGRPR